MPFLFFCVRFLYLFSGPAPGCVAFATAYLGAHVAISPCLAAHHAPARPTLSLVYWVAFTCHTHTPNFSWPCSEARVFITHARALPWADTSALTLTVLIVAEKCLILHMPEFICLSMSLLSQVLIMPKSCPGLLDGVGVAADALAVTRIALCVAVMDAPGTVC